MNEPTIHKYQHRQQEDGDTNTARHSLPVPPVNTLSGSRRKFLGIVRGVALAAAAAGAIGLEPLLGSTHSLARADNHREPEGSERTEEAAEIRIEAMKADRRISIPPMRQTATRSVMPTSVAPIPKLFCKTAPAG